MLTNTNRSTFTSFRITPSKSSVIFATVLRVGAPSLPISGCLAVESRPVDLGIRRGKGRRDADETSCERGRVVRGGVERCGVANGYCLKRWRMDHGCVGFPGKMDPFFFPAPFPTSCGEIKGMRWMVSAAYFFGISWWKFFLSHEFDICLNCYLSCKYWIKKSNEIFEFLFDFIHLNCIL